MRYRGGGRADRGGVREGGQGVLPGLSRAGHRFPPSLSPGLLPRRGRALLLLYPLLFLGDQQGTLLDFLLLV